MHRTVLVLVAVLMVAASATAADKFEPITKGGGIEVYTKVDFNKGDSPFTGQGRAAVALETRPDYVVSGRSLYVKRKEPRGYFGGRTQDIAIRYDALKRDNTTPTSPARVQDDIWRTVVFAVEDFHHNSDPPQRKVPADTEHTSLLFHGREL